MARQRKKQRPARRPRKSLNLGGPATITFYVVRFMVKTPDELREGTTAPEWIKRESPPTLSEDDARAAYQAVLDELMNQQMGIRSPQLIVRTVTEDILRDYDVERGNEMADSMQERLDAANAEAEASNDVDAVLDALASDA